MENELIQKYLLEIGRNENVHDVVVHQETVQAGGYLAEVLKARLEGKNKCLKLFVKFITARKIQNKDLGCLVFPVETNFYSNILNEFMKLHREHNIPELLISVPKMFKVINDESILLLVLEDLQHSGYQVWNNLKEPVDESHADLVLNEYGKLHAISFAFRKCHPEVFKQLSNKNEFFKALIDYYEGEKLLDSVAKKAAKAFTSEESRYAEALIRLNKNVRSFLKTLHNDNKYDVIIHGDSWIHNFMFRYENNIPEKVILIDFQLTRFGSPVQDLTYFLCTSGPSEIIFSKIDEKLRIYHNSLDRHLKLFGMNAETVFSYSTLKEEWNKYGRYGIFWGVTVNKMLVADKDELAKYHIENRVLDSFNFISRHEELYLKRMKSIVTYFYDNNII